MSLNRLSGSEKLQITQSQLADRITAHYVSIALWETRQSEPKGAYLKALHELAAKVKAKRKWVYKIALLFSFDSPTFWRRVLYTATKMLPLIGPQERSLDKIPEFGQRDIVYENATPRNLSDVGITVNFLGMAILDFFLGIWRVQRD